MTKDSNQNYKEAYTDLLAEYNSIQSKNVKLASENEALKSRLEILEAQNKSMKDYIVELALARKLV